MTSKLVHMPWMSWPQTTQLVEAFTRSNIAFKFVGGCVRDALLDIAIVDVDIATSSRPDAVMSTLESFGIRVIPTGIAHGTVTAVIDKKHFEITTLRKDVTTDGRHAEVAFTDDWKIDAARRDFTMNALYAGADGTITDYFGGVSDAQNGVVRFIGDAEQRIEEDALRILRFFRFSAKYAKNELDEAGLHACEKKRALLDGLSGERIQNEMFKLLVAPRAADMLETMQSRSILAHMIPSPMLPSRLDTLRLVEQENAITASAVLILALLIRSAKTDAGNLVEHIANRWKLSGADKKHLLALALPMPFPASEKQAKMHIRAQGSSDFIEQLLLHAAENQTAEIGVFMALAQQWNVPIFPVRGSDLLANGFASGKTLGEALAMLEEKWEASDYALSKKELLGFLSAR
jgi:poly(A) polymerase